MIEEVLTAWRINHAKTRTVLDGVSDEGLTDTLSTRGGRSVGRQLAHVHDVRRYQLEKRARPISAGLAVFASKDEPSRPALEAALEDSAERVEEWLRRAHAGEPGFKLLRSGLVPTLGYLVAHESHHRGNVLLTLKQCGHPFDRAQRDGLWDWNRL